MSHTVGIIRCQVGSEAYGFEMPSVISVHQTSALVLRTELLSIGAVGCVPVSGVGDVPVFRLADRWQERPDPQFVGRAASDEAAAESWKSLRRQHVVVVRSSLGLEGYLVDALSRVDAVPLESLRPVPALLNDPARRLFKAVVGLRRANSANSLCFVLTPDRLHRQAVPLATRHETPLLATQCREAETTAAAHGSARLLVFPLANDLAGRTVVCGLNAAQVVEISEPLPIRALPFLPAHVAGYVVWREQAVPVLRWNVALGLPDAGVFGRLVIVRHLGELLALPAPKNLKQRSSPFPHRPCAPPDGLEPKALLGAFQANAEWLVVPDLSHLSRGRPTGTASHMTA